MEENGRTAPQEPSASETPPPSPNKKLLNKTRIINGLLAVAVLIIVAGALYWVFGSGHSPKPVSSANSNPAKTTVQKTAQAANLPGLRLNSSKNYGDKYADGILPVGDGKYVTSGPRAGYVYACQNYASSLQQSQGGASVRGPWFIGATQYNVNKKLHVQGSVMWQASFSNTVSGPTRTIISNDLPNHPTGVFPISSTDPAYAYDRNPNHIEGQTFTYKLSADPAYSATPSCEGGQVGVMLTGVALFSAFDAGGRDAGAWEVQDSCSGHPQMNGIYHYHTLSSCIKNASVKTVIGFALDGFPITGPQVSSGNILTTSDLDECHGITSQIVLDGKYVTMYHYVMTQDFPYSVSCYRGTPIQPPGQQNAQQTGQTPPGQRR